MGEGVVREHKCLIVDPEPLRSIDHWLKFLPSVSLVKVKPEAEQKEEESKTNLTIAWRYQDLLEEKMLGVADVDSTAKQEFRFDNSKPMGSAVSNLPSQALNQE